MQKLLTQKTSTEAPSKYSKINRNNSYIWGSKLYIEGEVHTLLDTKTIANCEPSTSLAEKINVINAISVKEKHRKIQKEKYDS